MSHTKEVIMKLEELGPDALTHDELVFAHIIQKIEYCKQCKNDINAIDMKTNERICPICSSKEFETIEIDTREFKCTYCGKPAYPGYYKTWTKLPFVNIQRKSFYCGCGGWD
jgi:DNA-directed RNA polymerase subunit RPC12/RpoP